MKKIVVIIFLCLGLSGYGQELPAVIHQSPNAAAFAKYGQIPVSHYTGVPNISIPLHTIKSGEIELPLTLSYHAGGIQVSQEASWVGLGWSLSQGGMITRVIRGQNDLPYGNSELSNGYPRETTLPIVQHEEIIQGGQAYAFSDRI